MGVRTRSSIYHGRHSTWQKQTHKSPAKYLGCTRAPTPTDRAGVFHRSTRFYCCFFPHLEIYLLLVYYFSRKLYVPGDFKSSNSFTAIHRCPNLKLFIRNRSTIHQSISVQPARANFSLTIWGRNDLWFRTRTRWELPLLVHPHLDPVSKSNFPRSDRSYFRKAILPQLSCPPRGPSQSIKLMAMVTTTAVAAFPSSGIWVTVKLHRTTRRTPKRTQNPIQFCWRFSSQLNVDLCGP